MVITGDRALKATTAQAQEHESFHTLADSIPQLAWMADASGYIFWYNRRWYDYTGATPEEMEGWGWQKMHHPDEVGRVVERIRQAFATGEPWEDTFPLRSREGEYRWFLSRALPIRDEEGRVVRWFGTNTDITEQRQLEQELRDARTDLERRVIERTAELSRANFTLRAQVAERQRAEQSLRKQTEILESILHHMGDAVIVADRDARFLVFNPAAERMFGAGATETTAEEWSAQYGLFLPDGVTPFPRDELPLTRAIRGEEVDDVEMFVRHTGAPEGLWTRVTGRPLRDAAGGLAGGVIVCRDIAERKRAEEALRQTQGDLARMSRVTALGELAASIAHEVNQPLASIIGNADICLTWLSIESPDLAQVREAVADIHGDGQRAGEVLKRIRNLVRKDTAQKSRLDINEVVGEVTSLVAGAASARRVRVQSRPCADLPPVLGDRVQLQQVFLNLMMNAMDAMGAVEEERREIVVETGADGDGGGVLVAVRDRGPGLAPSDAEKVFGAFYTTKPEGMGMGLSISRSIIRAHGGRLWAGNNEGGGACFRFTLPPAEATP